MSPVRLDSRDIKQVTVMRYGMMPAEAGQIIIDNHAAYRVVARTIRQPTDADLRIWRDLWPGDYIVEMELAYLGDLA